ncbi:DUF3857 domain-containing protein [Flavobacterium sp.]|uniref:DUF3857 domain-containing protein n=2 Tax=unclassified Flavobacterium TaxID=196869 RepID=UPI0031CFD100
MKIIKLLSLSWILLVAPKAISQEFKLGKVSIAELEQKVHPKDSSAAAAILYKKGISRMEFDQNEGFCIVTDVEARIKIYKKEGYEWANQSVWYYNQTNLKERVFFSDAVTYNLVNGKIEKTKLKSDGSFDEVLSKFRGLKKITMPNVKEGSVIEYHYSIRCPSDNIIRDWDFQTSIPVNYSEFKIAYPEYYVFKPRQKGYIFPKVSTTKNSKSLTINSKERGTGLVSRTEFYNDK